MQVLKRLTLNKQEKEVRRRFGLKPTHYITKYRAADMLDLCQRIVDASLNKTDGTGPSYVSVESLKQLCKPVNIDYIKAQNFGKGTLTDDILYYLCEDMALLDLPFAFLNIENNRSVKTSLIDATDKDIVLYINEANNKLRKFLYEIALRKTKYITATGVITVPFNVNVTVYNYTDMNGNGNDLLSDFILTDFMNVMNQYNREMCVKFFDSCCQPIKQLFGLEKELSNLLHGLIDDESITVDESMIYEDTSTFDDENSEEESGALGARPAVIHAILKASRQSNYEEIESLGDEVYKNA